MIFWIWPILAILAILLEIVTPTALVSVWFSLGALSAWLLQALNMPDWVQILGFVLISLLCLALFRPLADQWLRGNVEATNADRVIGQTGIVTQDINRDRWGEVLVAHTKWSAADRDGNPVSKGNRVRILAIEGAKLIVTPVKGE